MLRMDGCRGVCGVPCSTEGGDGDIRYMNIPIFKKGDPISASKFNQLGAAIRNVGEGGAGGQGVAWRKGAERRDESFAVAWRVDSVSGEEGWCVHRGVVRVGGEEFVVGSREWCYVAGEAWSGSIYLKLSFGADGSVSGEFVTDGGDGAYLLAEVPVEGDVVWYWAGCVVPLGGVSYVGGNGIYVEESQYEGKKVVLVEDRVSYVGGDGVSVIDGVGTDGVRRVTIAVDSVVSVEPVCVVAGPGIKVEESVYEGKRVYKVSIDVSYIAGPGLMVDSSVVGELKLAVDVSYVAREMGLGGS